MGTIDKRVDAYIAKSAAFAQPILHHLRELVHKACPDIEETIKWGFPNFEYHGLLGNMAAFKEHCTFSFWKASLLNDPHGVLEERGESAMGHFGRIQTPDDLPSDKVILDLLKQAMKLNEQGVKAPVKPKPAATKELVVPEYFMIALGKNKKASRTFEAFSPSHKKEYVAWVIEAKTDETREKRLATAIEWMAEGKVRMWKYAKK